MSKKIKDKRQRIPLSKYTLGGRAATVIAVTAVIFIFAAIGLSVSRRGNAGTPAGVLGACALLLGVAGFITGIRSFKEETKFLRYSWIGTIANLIIWVIMLMMLLTYI